MKKTVLLCALFLLIAIPSQAQAIKFITLTDGSVIKGKVIGLADGFYTIDTSHLGAITIEESEVQSITSSQQNRAQATNRTGKSSAQLQSQVQALQQSVLSDPAVMEDIQKLMEDKAVMQIMKDPNFIQDIMSYDPNRIGNNNKTQELMNNPEMKALMEKISGKIKP